MSGLNTVPNCRLPRNIPQNSSGTWGLLTCLGGFPLARVAFLKLVLLSAAISIKPAERATSVCDHGPSLLDQVRRPPPMLL